MGWLIRLLLFAGIVYLIVSGLRRLFLPSTAPQHPREARQQQEGELMVQDPQCGRFVLERQACTASVQGQVCYFCSQECRDLYTRARATS
jgi:YHS domain-containing protein